MSGEPMPVEHLLAHISDALALDGRVGELGLDVHEEASASGRRIVVSGHVTTYERKRAIVAVVGELLAGHGEQFFVVDRTAVASPDRPDGGAEVLS